MPRKRSVLYIGASLPARSETFVYREVFALRDAGVPVHVASVHDPQVDLGEARLDALADEAIGVYGPGWKAMAIDAASEIVMHPWRAVRVLGRAVGDAVMARDVTVRARPKILAQAVAGLALAWRVRERDVAIIHAHMAHVPTTIGMYAAMALGVPFSFTGHASDLFRSRSLLREKLTRAAFVSCISGWHRRFYQGIVRQAARRLPVIRCGVDVSAFEADDSRAPNPTTHIVSVARLVPKKGLDILVHAVAHLHDRGIPVRCSILGDGPQRAELVQRCQELGVSDVVTLAGACDNVEVRRTLSTADLFVLPCRVANDGDRDGIPVALMEAMSSGVAVISGDLPTIRELVRTGETGVLVPPGDVDAVAEAMKTLIEKPELRAALATGGRRRIEDEFSMAVNVTRLQRAFHRALGPMNFVALAGGRRGGRPMPPQASRNAA